jgi:hypothetical protein
MDITALLIFLAIGAVGAVVLLVVGLIKRA